MEVVVIAVTAVIVGTSLNVSHWIKELKRLFAEWTLLDMFLFGLVCFKLNSIGRGQKLFQKDFAWKDLRPGALRITDACKCELID